jgi:hypothetical protein
MKTLLMLLPLLALSLLTGCTTTTSAIYAGLETQAKAGIVMANDNAITTARDFLCGQPYSAVQRHPEIQAAIASLCGPLANASSLDPNQLALLMNILKSAGITVAPSK